MCLKSLEPIPISPDIAAWGVTQLASTNPYRLIGDTLFARLHTLPWQNLYHREGKPALSPVVLALVTLFQHTESLSDVAAVHAVQTRLDWKYALHRPLVDDGFDPSVLTEFRQRLLDHAATTWVFDQLLTLIQEHGLFRPRGRQRTDSTHVLAKIRALNRLETVGETMRLVLNTLATGAPAWLTPHLQPDWTTRYGPRFDAGRLPTSQAQRDALALQIGQDGVGLLAALDDPTTPRAVRDLAVVQTFRTIWNQQYMRVDGTVRWRSMTELPTATEAYNSPHDPDARYSSKRSTIWVGYRVHLTECCDSDLPRIITNVELTPAPIADTAMTPVIHQQLATADRVPSQHLLDAGYLDADHLVTLPQQYQVELVGSVPRESSWQTRAKTGYHAGAFSIDWASQTATCPQGQTSTMWRLEHDGKGNPTTHIEFALAPCRACAVRSQCTQSTTRGRQLNIRREAQHTALQAARQRQTTAAFKAAYAMRAGIEGTLSDAVRTRGLRRSRYVGQAKTTLQAVFLAAGLNLTRMSAWLAGERPRPTPVPALVRLSRTHTTAFTPQALSP